MSAEASGGGVESELSAGPAAGGVCVREEKAAAGLASSKYVKLNVGGSLHYTTVQTLRKEDSLLSSICDGHTEVTIDSEGKCVCVCVCVCVYGEMESCVKGIVGNSSFLFSSQPVVKLQNNRGNNKYSYTSNSDDNLLKNIELFDKLGLRFNGRVLFMKDVLGDEICCWSFYGEGRKIAEVCCTSIVYATEKKQTKVEFPEARIFEETLNILIYENGRSSGPGGVALLESGMSSSPGAGQSEEEGAAGGGDRRVRRIHVRRHIMHDERGHGQQTVYKD
ncbi:BTB/POZ domain-containing adapter for CUL3-mediated RhoA degradation protein 1 [Alosa sapidissima]|uniref:BTB/POZ domain-containing adapter for CUL3-mediated RhoA degradation protein 1 n=1 Tax=Alosa sapidissima TaxID=34773 RepID=UPI001C086CE8|nr:BTB/POZ domain-containing adapter for CUL3-mediated RhoA degradation protein 1 [Alosa sapidissima]